MVYNLSDAVNLRLCGVVGLPDLSDLPLSVELHLRVVALVSRSVAARGARAPEAEQVRHAEHDQQQAQHREHADQRNLQGCQERPIRTYTGKMLDDK